MNQPSERIQVALVDDAMLLRNALAQVIDGFGNCQVMLLADHGQELVQALQKGKQPQVILLDQAMPQMDGLETSSWLFENHPEINILMLSQYDSDIQILRLLQNGVKGFLKKDIHHSELKFAIETASQGDFYHSAGKPMRIVHLYLNNQLDDPRIKNLLTDQELRFVKLSAQGFGNEEIASKMNRSTRTIDAIRANVYQKLNVQSRAELIAVLGRHGFGLV